VSYSVKEIYRTLQGEGANTGRAAVLCRFAGCNLWTGREADRSSAICQFCDTDFFGTDGPDGGKFPNADALASQIAGTWGADRQSRLVICTGGEPLLQLDEALIGALHAHDFQIAVETNGTLETPMGIDWLCVSPKAGAPLRLRAGNELKLVFPQEGLNPEDLAKLDFDHFFLQPMDGPNLREHWCKPVSAAISRVERPARRARSKPSRRAALALSR
jgi:7-carboxy-7-deazaguanine synthase